MEYFGYSLHEINSVHITIETNQQAYIDIRKVVDDTLNKRSQWSWGRGSSVIIIFSWSQLHANVSEHACIRCVSLCVHVRISIYSETLPGENQNLFATLTVRTYVRIVPNWKQQSLGKSTERQVWAVSSLDET